MNHESEDMEKGAAVAYFKGTIPASIGKGLEKSVKQLRLSGPRTGFKPCP